MEKIIIETINKKTNGDISAWYRIKVLEAANFLLKKSEKEKDLVETNEPVRFYQLEVMAK